MNVLQVSQSLSHLLSAFTKAERWCEKLRTKSNSPAFCQAAGRHRQALRVERMAVRHVLQQCDQPQLDTFLPFAPVELVDRSVSKLICRLPQSIDELDELMFPFTGVILEALWRLQHAAENTLAVGVFDSIVGNLEKRMERYAVCRWSVPAANFARTSVEFA